MTVWSDNAQRFATRRGTLMAAATADHILEVAVERAVATLRGRHVDQPRARAALVLADAERRARVLLTTTQTAAAPTSTPGAAAGPDAHAEGEAAGRPVTLEGVCVP